MLRFRKRQTWSAWYLDALTEQMDEANVAGLMELPDMEAEAIRGIAVMRADFAMYEQGRK